MTDLRKEAQGRMCRIRIPNCCTHNPADMKSKQYLAFVRSLPCCHCGAMAEPHHIIGIDHMGKTGGKQGDLHTMPLCREDHAEVHKCPKEFPQTRWMMETQQAAILAGIIVLKFD